MSQMTAIKIPTLPSRGEIWFSINLGLIEDVPALYQALSELNLKPQLAYKQFAGGTEVHLLLHHEVRDEMAEPPHDLFEHEQRTLADIIDPNAMSFSCGLTRQPVAA